MIEITLRIPRAKEIDIFGVCVKKKGDVLAATSNLLRKHDTRLEGSKIVFRKGSKSETISAMASDDMIQDAVSKL